MVFPTKEPSVGRRHRESGKHPATWEKKGNGLITSRNIRNYYRVRAALIRIINQINSLDGKLLYYGREKYLDPQHSNATGLYTTVLSHTIRQLDRYCDSKNEKFLLILDEHESRLELLEAAAKTMFGQQAARCLLEPPFQVESHLYQTIQAADWIASLIGRLLAYRVSPTEYSDWDWAETIYGRRINAVSTHSILWRPKSAQGRFPSKLPIFKGGTVANSPRNPRLGLCLAPASPRARPVRRSEPGGYLPARTLLVRTEAGTGRRRDADARRRPDEAG